MRVVLLFSLMWIFHLAKYKEEWAISCDFCFMFKHFCIFLQFCRNGYRIKRF